MDRPLLYKCYYCDSRFTEVDDLCRHTDAGCPKHSSIGFARKEWLCGNCPSDRRRSGTASYVTSWRFKQHLRRAHRLRNTPSPVPVDPIEDSGLQTPLSILSSSDDEAAADEAVADSLSSVVPVFKSNAEIASGLSRELAAIVADSLQDTGMTEKVVQFFMNRFMHYHQTAYAASLQQLYSRFTSERDVSACCEKTLTSFLDETSSIMEAASKPMRSTHTRMAYFVRLGCYIKPEARFAKRDEAEVVRNIISDKDFHLGYDTDQFVQFIPMRATLKKLFEIPGFLKEVLEWGEVCRKKPEVACFSESREWLKAARSRQHAKPGSLFFPIHVYYDDFEAGNALGSHSGVHKLGGVYFSLPFLPPRLVSTLKFILLAAVFKSRVRELQGNKAVFTPVIKELEYLYKEGITVTLDDGSSVVVQFGLGCLVGDNLGMNAMLGFTTSFKSSKCCRVCYVSREDFYDNLHENEELLRTTATCDADLLRGEPTSTGVVEPCVWNELSYFKIESHCSVDFMHDMFEGVARYTMQVVLKGLICRNGAFDLPLLNDRIRNLSYGPDSSSQPMPISTAPNQTFSVRMSAAEMRNFIVYFGLMIGHKIDVGEYDFIPTRDGDQVVDDIYSQPSTSGGRGRGGRKTRRVPPSKKNPARSSTPVVHDETARLQKKKRVDDSEDFYKLYLLLNRVMTLISQDSVSLSKALYLRHVIALFLDAFRIVSLKVKDEALAPPFKFHVLTHYPSMMLKHGPLPALSTFRFESKNKQLKTGLKNSFNNVNTPFSAAKKEQYHLNHLFFHNVLPSAAEVTGKMTSLTDQTEINDIYSALHVDSSVVKKIKVVTTGEGLRFITGYVVCLHLDNRGMPVFAKILDMYFNIETKETYFKGENYKTVMFSEHFRAYEVQSLDFSSYYKLSDREYPFPNTLVKALDYNDYVVFRNSL